MEHSERGREVTEQVALWITNDGDHYFQAQAYADAGDLSELERYVTDTIRGAHQPAPAWYVGRDLAPNDFDRIDWESVAHDLTEE